MAFVKIKNLLKETMGLSSESIGDSSIERAINHRKDILKINHANSYLSLLMENEDELNELVEEVVVPETWFFRNLVPFESLSACLPDLNKRKSFSGETLKILSLPCSTGEEPYSIAITLLENGFKEDHFQIDAQDISKRALKKARRAIYGKHSFREAGRIDVEKYFRKTRSGLQLLPVVRDRVSFIQSNIIKNMIMPGPEYYDVIFCRNLLIYFDRKTQKETLEKLHFMLKPGGTLFVGHAETSEVEKQYFTKIDAPKSFAYRKKKLGINQNLSDGKNHTNQLMAIYENLVEITQKDVALSRKINHSGRNKNTEGVSVKHVKEISILSHVEELIEKGRLSDASSLCEKQLKESPDNAQAYYYLGLISKMEGSVGAAELLLKKSVYLDPDHHKALSLFCLLAGRRGDEDLAESLRRREERARKRTKAI